MLSLKIVGRIFLILICLILAGYLAYKIAYPYVAPMVFDYIVDHHMDAFVKLEQSLFESLDQLEISGESEPQSDGDSGESSGEVDSGSLTTADDSAKTDEFSQSNESEKTDSATDSKPSGNGKGTQKEKTSGSDKTGQSETSSGSKNSASKQPSKDSISQKTETGAVVPSSQSEDASANDKNNTEIQSVKTTMGVFSGAHLARALKNMSPADKTRIISLCQSAVSTADILKVTKMMMQDGLTKDQQKYIENFLRDNLSVPYKREILEILQKY